MKSSQLDPVLLTPSRLAVVLTLADGGAWSFTSLRDATGLADGNLHVQTRRLEEAGYVRRDAGAGGGRRVTLFRLTSAGRAALARHARQVAGALDGPEGDRPPQRRQRRGELDPRSDTSRVW